MKNLGDLLLLFEECVHLWSCEHFRLAGKAKYVLLLRSNRRQGWKQCCLSDHGTSSEATAYPIRLESGTSERSATDHSSQQLLRWTEQELHCHLLGELSR
jgi:hypothetical protein